MANISKSTPYVRYREKFTSNVHLGTIHVESEYLDNTRPTTIESIHGMTWHNRIYNENKELPVLSDRNILLNTKQREYFDTGEKRVPIDEIHGLEDCVANSDGTYTYKVETVEGDYAETYDGINHITSSSNGLSGEVEITYNTNEEDITGSLVFDMVNGGNVTIENSKQGELTGAILKGNTLVNLCQDLENEISTTTVMYLTEEIPVKTNAKYMVVAKVKSSNPLSSVQYSSFFRVDNSTTGYILGGINGDITTDYTTKSFTFDTGNATTLKITLRNAYSDWGLTENIAYAKEVMLIEYQEGMENLDIPYFTGMQSVRMPVLKTVGKNLWDNKVFEDCPIATINNDGSITLNGTLQGHWLFNYTIDKGTYCASAIGNDNAYIHLFWQGVDIAFQQNHSFTASEKVTRQGYIARGTYDNVNIKLQLEVGTQVTSYEPLKCLI